MNAMRKRARSSQALKGILQLITGQKLIKGFFGVEGLEVSVPFQGKVCIGQPNGFQLALQNAADFYVVHVYDGPEVVGVFRVLRLRRYQVPRP